MMQLSPQEHHEAHFAET